MDEIDGSILKVMMLKAADYIISHEDVLNELNYFPVRDRDTGTNLRLVFENIKRKIENTEIRHIGKLLEIIKDVSIKTSKGNSGNILSMFFYGLYLELKDKEKVTIKDLSAAIKKAKEYAYSSVRNPKEGTMLTVIRVMEEEISNNVENFVHWLKRCIKRSLKELKNNRREIDLNNTIDSGGLGIVLMLKGWVEALGENVRLNFAKYLKKEKKKIENKKAFCVNILARSTTGNIDEIKNALDNENSLIINEVGEYVKIHFHTNDVEKSLNKILPFIDIEDIKVEEING